MSDPANKPEVNGHTPQETNGAEPPLISLNKEKTDTIKPQVVVIFH